MGRRTRQTVFIHLRLVARRRIPLVRLSLSILLDAALHVFARGNSEKGQNLRLSLGVQFDLLSVCRINSNAYPVNRFFSQYDDKFSVDDSPYSDDNDRRRGTTRLRKKVRFIAL